MTQTQKKRMLDQKLYKVDQNIKKEAIKAKILLQQYNNTDVLETEKRNKIIKQLFGKIGKNYYIEPPFYCDFGQNTYVGENLYINTNAIFLDVAKITIGDNVMLGPRVGLYTAGHPLDPIVRNTQLEFGKEIHIGNNVWIGGSSVVCPGVSIGDNTVIGAGSVVTKDIPANCVAVGNPCKVLRQLTNEDKKYWQDQQKEYEQEMNA